MGIFTLRVFYVFLLISCFEGVLKGEVVPDRVKKRIEKLLEVGSFGKGVDQVQFFSHRLEKDELTKLLGLSEEEVEKGFCPIYRLHAHNLPKKNPFYLIQLKMDGSWECMGSYRSLDDGAVVSCSGEAGAVTLENNLVGADGFMDGEWVKYMLISKNGKFGVVTDLVPHPFEGSTQTGCSLKGRWMGGEMFNCLFTGEGFNPNETLTLSSQSLGELLEGSIEATGEGKVVFSLAPAVVGKSGGVATVELIRESKERVTVDLTWGDAVKKHQMVKRG